MGITSNAVVEGYPYGVWEGDADREPDCETGKDGLDGKNGGILSTPSKELDVLWGEGDRDPDAGLDDLRLLLTSLPTWEGIEDPEAS